MADDDGNIKEDMRRWKHEGHPTGMWHAAKAIYSYLHILARAAQRSSPLDQIGPTEPPAGQGSRGWWPCKLRVRVQTGVFWPKQDTWFVQRWRAALTTASLSRHLQLEGWCHLGDLISRRLLTTLEVGDQRQPHW